MTTGDEIVIAHEFPDRPSRDRVVEQYSAIEGGKQHLANAAAYIAELG